MAYSPVDPVTPSRTWRIGDREFRRYEITEAEARDTSEFTLSQVPAFGEIVLYRAKLVSGTGTTVQPEIGNAAAWVDGSIDEQGRIDTAAAYVNESTQLAFDAPDGVLVCRSAPNSVVADHAISTVIILSAGVF